MCSRYNTVVSFFPTINIQEVDKINEFHGQLIGILKAKLLAEIKVCQNLITEYNIQMENINQEINKILKCKNPVGLAVDNLIRLKSHRDNLIKKIEDTDKFNQYNQDKRPLLKIIQLLSIRRLREFSND